MKDANCNFCPRFENGCAVHYVDESKLQGPPVGSLVVHAESKYDFTSNRIMRVTQQSYVWAPGDPSYGGGSRRYDWCVVEYMPGPNGTFATLCVDNKDLTELKVGAFIK